MDRTFTVRIKGAWLKYLAIVLVTVVVAAPLTVWASSGFTDVPDANPFHDDIDWLADSGVTLGCAVGEYCPSDNVTREQMAAFLRRLSEGQIVEAASAQTINGFEDSELRSKAWFAGGDQAMDVTDTDTVVRVLPIAAPAGTDGIAIVNSSLYAVQTTQGDQIWCSISVGSTALDFDALEFWESSGNGQGAVGAMSGTRGISLAAGESQTINLVCRVNGASGIANIRDSSLTAIFVPS